MDMFKHLFYLFPKSFVQQMKGDRRGKLKGVHTRKGRLQKVISYRGVARLSSGHQKGIGATGPDG